MPYSLRIRLQSVNASMLLNLSSLNNLHQGCHAVLLREELLYEAHVGGELVKVDLRGRLVIQKCWIRSSWQIGIDIL